jgi:hypothetical protein
MGSSKLGGTFTRCKAKAALPTGFRRVFEQEIGQRVIVPLSHDNAEDRTAGWAAFAHPLDTHLTVEKFLFNEYLCLAFRVDEYKLPGGTLKLLKREAELQWLAENHRDAMPRPMRKALFEDVRRALRAGTPETIKSIPVVWNTDTGQVWIWTQSSKVLCEIRDLFVKTFSQELEKVDPESLLESLLESPLDEGTEIDELAEGFLAYLWLQAERERPLSVQGEPVSVFFESRMHLSGNSEAEQFDADDPTQVVEARQGLHHGKHVCAARLRLRVGDRDYLCTLRAQTLELRSVKLPVVLSRQEDEQFYEQLYLLEALDRMVNTMFSGYLELRMGDGWGDVQDEIEEMVEHD